MKKLFAGLAAVVFGLSAYAADTEIKGKLGCAHCDYEKGSHCAIGVKSADGKVYLVTMNDKKDQDKLFKERQSGKSVVVKGEVSGTEVKGSSAKIQD